MKRGMKKGKWHCTQQVKRRIKGHFRMVCKPGHFRKIRGKK